MVPGEGQPTTGKQGKNALMISQENAEHLTADVVFVVTEKGSDTGGGFQAALDADPRLDDLPSTQNGTLLFLSAEQWSANNRGDPASYQWWLNHILPVLEKSALNQRGA